MLVVVTVLMLSHVLSKKILLLIAMSSFPAAEGETPDLWNLE